MIKYNAVNYTPHFKNTLADRDDGEKSKKNEDLLQLSSTWSINSKKKAVATY
jgi:hypothetical protein